MVNNGEQVVVGGGIWSISWSYVAALPCLLDFLFVVLCV